MKKKRATTQRDKRGTRGTLAQTRPCSTDLRPVPFGVSPNCGHGIPTAKPTILYGRPPSTLAPDPAAPGHRARSHSQPETPNPKLETNLRHSNLFQPVPRGVCPVPSSDYASDQRQTRSNWINRGRMPLPSPLNLPPVEPSRTQSNQKRRLRTADCGLWTLNPQLPTLFSVSSTPSAFKFPRHGI